MRCYECGVQYEKRSSTLPFNNKHVGQFSIELVNFKECPSCKKQLLNKAQVEIVEAEAKRILDLFISKLNIAEFVFASEAQVILGCTRQAFHKNKRIRNGFIYSYKIGDRKVYHKESIKLFKETGDGRFPLYQKTTSNIQPYEKKSTGDLTRYSYLGVSEPVCREDFSFDNKNGQVEFIISKELTTQSTPYQILQ